MSKILALVQAAGLICLAGTAAFAQSASVAQTAPVATFDGLIPKGVTITVGAAAVYEPRYAGAKRYEFNAIPVIKFGGMMTGPLSGLDVRGLDDIAFGLLKSGPLQFGPATGYRDDRNQSDGPRLRGLGDVDGGLLAGGFGRYDMGPAYLRASYLRQVTGDDTGGLFRFIAGADYHLTPTTMFHAFTGIEAGDSTFNQTYFGVTAAQAARSTLPAFAPGGGINSYHLGAGIDYEVIATWTLVASAEYIRYLGAASRSPIVEETDQYRIRLGVAKSFDASTLLGR